MKRKSASQTAQRFSKNVTLLIFSVLTLCASPAIAQDCIGNAYWNVASGSWFYQNNWSGHSVPTLNTRVEIDNGGTATIGSTGAVSCDLTLAGVDATQSGTVVVDHGSLTTTFDHAIGAHGRGVLNITNGGTVSAVSAAIAASAGSQGAVTVDGTNSQWTLSAALNVGAGGAALLTITDGGTVTATSVHLYPSGTLTGNGTVTTTSGTTTMEGTLEPSSGRLTIGGGDLTFNNTNTTPLMQCNVVPASADNVYVSGAKALLTGKLKVRMTGTFTPGTIYTLLHADGGLNGTQFSTVSIIYPTGQCFTPVVTYDASNVYLTLQANCF